MLFFQTASSTAAVVAVVSTTDAALTSNLLNAVADPFRLGGFASQFAKGCAEATDHGLGLDLGIFHAWHFGRCRCCGSARLPNRCSSGSAFRQLRHRATDAHQDH